MDVLKILGNKKRREILKILAKKSMHVAALARELGISSPVVLAHVLLLESANFVERERVGNTTVVKIRKEAVELLLRLEDLFEKPTLIEAKRGESLYNVLMNVPGIRMRNWEGTEGFYVSSIDNIEGQYIFLVDGKPPEVSVDKYIVSEEITLEFQRLLPVVGRRIRIVVKQ